MCRRLSVMFVAMLAAGCVAPATMTLKDGRAYEAVIEGSDQDNLYVREDGKIKRLERSRVEEVSHPGVGLMVMGGVGLMGAAASLIAASTLVPDDDNDIELILQRTSYIGSAAVIGLSLGSLIMGWQAYEGSSEAASGEVRWQVAPLVAPGGRGGGVGVTVSW